MDEAAGDRFHSERPDAIEISLYGALALALVLGEQRGRYGRGVDERVIDDRLARAATVLEDLFDVLRGGEAERLVGLGHEIANIDAGGRRGGDGLRNTAHE